MIKEYLSEKIPGMVRELDDFEERMFELPVDQQVDFIAGIEEELRAMDEMAHDINPDSVTGHRLFTKIRKIRGRLRRIKTELDFYDPESELDRMFPDRHDPDFDPDRISYDRIFGTGD